MVDSNGILSRLAELDAADFERLKAELSLFGLLGITPEDLLALKEMIALWPMVKEALLLVSQGQQERKPAELAASTYENIKMAAGLGAPTEAIRFGKGEDR